MGFHAVCKAHQYGKARNPFRARACKPYGQTDVTGAKRNAPRTAAYSTSAYCALGVKSYTTRVICFSSAMMRAVTRSNRS